MNEHMEQSALCSWVNLVKDKHPELKMLFAIPNGGHRHIAVATKLKKEGVRPGVPDLFLPVPMCDFHGLFIEMKTDKGTVTKHQKAWMENLKSYGYQVKVCKGFEAARLVLLKYIGAIK